MLDPSVILPNAGILQSIAQPAPVPTPFEQQAAAIRLQSARQQAQIGALDIQQRQREIDAQRLLNNAMQAGVTTGPDGTPVFNKQAIAQSFIDNGRGDLVPDFMTHLTATEKAASDAAKAKSDAVQAAQKVAEADNNLVGMTALGVKQHGYTPEAATTALAYLQAHQKIDPAAAVQLTQQIQANPTKDAIKFLIDPLIARSKDATEADTKAQETATKAAEETRQRESFELTKPGVAADVLQKQIIAAAPALQQAATSGTYAQALAALPQAVQDRFTNLGQSPTSAAILRASLPPDKQAEYDATQTGLAQGAQRIVLARDRVALDRELQTDAGLSPEATDTAARLYLQTGQLPNLGMGKAAAQNRSNILNKASILDPSADIASAKAGFAADETSLKNLQKNRDTTVAFENTAGKNLDQFLKTAKGVVDSGSPLLNMPLRTLSGKLAGNPNQAVFEAARQVASTEIAKVLNNPGANTALSDSARHEAQSLLGPDITLKQLVQVANLLRQDMSNRRDSMDQGIAEIKGRLGGNKSPAASSSGGATTSKATKRYNPITGKIEAIP